MKAYKQICQEIGGFLKSKPNLSRKYIAEKAGISSAYLTMVLQGKRALTEDLAIKILRVLKKSNEIIDNYLMQIRLENNMPTIASYYKEKQDEEKHIKLTRESSRLLSRNIDLINCFEDIQRLKKIHKNRLVDLYGRTVVQKVEILADNGTIKKENDYFSINDDRKFIHHPEDAFELMKTSLDHECFEWKQGANCGIAEFNITELSEDSYKELLKIIAKQIKETNTFIEKNQLNNRSYKGGKRVNIIHALTGLKQFSLAAIFLFCIFITGNFNQILADGPDPLSVDKTDLGRPVRSIILSQGGGAGPGGTDPYRGVFSNRSAALGARGVPSSNTDGQHEKPGRAPAPRRSWLARYFTTPVDMKQDHAQN